MAWIDAQAIMTQANSQETKQWITDTLFKLLINDNINDDVYHNW